MNKVDSALNQLDAESIKTENDLSFKMPITTVDKGKNKEYYSDHTYRLFSRFIEEKPDTPEATPPVPKGKNENFWIV